MLVPTAARCATPEIAALVQRLARPAPATIAFTEVRFSPLLREPLVVSGELSYGGPASLDRRVMQPYREDTAIRGESVRVEREGEPARSFSTKRAPQLRDLLAGFSALLTGDAAAVERNFTAQLSDSERGWALTLAPKDHTVRKRLRQILINGQADQPRCFTMDNAGGSMSVMLLGEAANMTLPPQPTLEWIRKQCEEGRGAHGVEPASRTESTSRNEQHSSRLGVMPGAPLIYCRSLSSSASLAARFRSVAALNGQGSRVNQRFPSASRSP